MNTAKKSSKLKVRELYCPSHFGNTYEGALPNEMTALLSEAKFWGFNRFTDWFDTIDLYDVYRKKHNLFNMPEAMWQQKFSNYQCAGNLGFELGLVVTPNHVFSNQANKDNRAKQANNMFGQLVCPAKSGIIEMILENYKNIFQDFKKRGLILSSISGGAYDYGGCGCEKCRPWIVTFGKLFKQIGELAKYFFKDIKVELWGWWWSDVEYLEFSKWANAEAKGFFEAISMHILYGKTNYVKHPLPINCAEKAFVHISYSETNNGDTYNHYGANIAPIRLEKTVRNLIEQKAKGFMAYSEGAHDDINKAILAGLASGTYSFANEVLEEYALRYFGNEPKNWSELIFLLGNFETIPVTKCRPMFDKLAQGSHNTWRLQQIAGRLSLAEAHQRVVNENDWTPSRISAAEKFMAEKENLYRNVWGLGLQRHIFTFNANMPQWYESFSKLNSKKKNSSIPDRLKEA